MLLVQVVLGQPPPGYYDAAQGLSGPELRTALHGIIAPHQVQANSTLWAAFAMCDARPDGTVWDIYSDQPGGTPDHVFQFGADQCGEYEAEGDCFNREHSFPQSWYGQGAPMSTDLFHIYPTDGWVNQQRGNLAYGMVSNPVWTSSNGSRTGNCSWPGCNGSVFEPIDAYKGDLARSYFYMHTRYLTELPGWSSPMMLGGAFAPWAVSMLLQWHADDPVSAKELDRNNCIFGLQGNRNPYIDQPEWVELIWGIGVGVDEAVNGPIQAWYHDGLIHWRTDAGAGPVRILITDMSGRIVHEVNSSAAMAHVNELPAGLYLAIIDHAAGRGMLRFVH